VYESRVVTGVFGSKSTSSLSVLFNLNHHRYKSLSYPIIRTMYRRDIVHNIVARVVSWARTEMQELH
jgi:hypothetical protein